MWRSPNRPDNRISQSFNDGLVTVYEQTDAAAPGYQPQPVLEKKVALRYEERRLGIQRYYAAAQNQQRIERVLRVPKTAIVNAQDVAITEDGRKYRIELVQLAPDVYPPCVDLTLSRIEQNGEVTG